MRLFVVALLVICLANAPAARAAGTEVVEPQPVPPPTAAPAQPALAAAPAPGAGEHTVDWAFLDKADAQDRDLVTGYAETARRLDALALRLARRFPSALLQVEVREDLARVRWRAAGELPGVWTEAIVCPADRELLMRVEGALAPFASGRTWRTLAIRGDRLVAPAEWNGRAVLVRPDGGIVRLLRID